MESQEIQRFEQQGVALIDQARAIRIVDQASREAAVAFSTNAQRAIKQIKDFFAEPKKKAHEAWRSICDKEKILSDKFEQAKVITDGEISRDWQEQERIRREAEAKARAEAAEKERKERERLQKLAEKQMEAGKFERAEETLAQAEQVFMPVVTPAAPEPVKTTRIEGGASTVVEDIAIEVTDPMAAIRAIAAGQLPVHLVKFEMGEIKKYAKALKSSSLPGIKIQRTARVSTRVA